MIRRFNYTGRIKLRRDCASIILSTNGGQVPYVQCVINLDGYKLPENAHVYLEPHFRSQVMRCPLGTVDSISRGARNFTFTLNEIDSTEIFFRIKVVDESNEIGRLIAEVDGIKPQDLESEDSNKQPILPVREVDLGPQIWRLNIPGSLYELPVLDINETIASQIPMKELLRSNPLLRSLVLPAVVREILTHILFIDCDNIDLDDRDDWRSMWIRFANDIPEIPSLDEDISKLERDELLEWVENAAQGFCFHYDIKNQFESVNLT